MARNRWSPYRWHRHLPLRLGLVAATLASLSISVMVVPQQPAAALPQGSSPDLYVTGSQQANVFSFAGNALGTGAASQPGSGLKAVADTTDGARTVVIGRTSHTPMAFVLDPATGTKVGSMAFPGLPLVGVAADPGDSNLVLVASQNTLYSADVQTLQRHTLYTLPSTAKSTFSSLAISPNGARAYLGGANSSSGSPVNAIFAVKLAGPPATSEWVAPTNDRFFTGEVTDLTFTPNGKDLYATNNSSLSSTVAPTTTTTTGKVPTMLTVTGLAPNLNEIQWHWTANDNGSPITDWVLSLSLNGVVTTQVKIPGPASYTSAVGCGGGSWTLQVSAINKWGQSTPLTSSPVTIQPNCATQPSTTPSTSPTTTPTTTASSGTASTQGSTTQSVSTTAGCGIACIVRTVPCLVCRITTTTAPIIQGPELPPVATTVTQSPPNVPSARLLIDAVAFGFPVPFHSPHPPVVTRPLPPPGTLPSVIVPLPYPSVPAARSITVSPDGLDVYVGSAAGFTRTIPYLTGFPVAQPLQRNVVALPTTNTGTEPAYRANVSIAMSPDGRTLVAAVAGQDDSETDLDVVGTTSAASAPPSMVAPASASRILHDGWPTGQKGIAITPDQSPVPRFTAAVGQVGTASTFDAGASTVQFGSIASYNWSFGDGKTGTGQTASHVYASTGTFTVQLCETGSAGTSTAATVPGTSFSVDTPGQTPYWNSLPCASHTIRVPAPSTTVTTPTTATTVTTATTPTTAKVTTSSGTTPTTKTVTTKGTVTTRPTTTGTPATTALKTTSTHHTGTTGTGTTVTVPARTTTTRRSTTSTATTSPARRVTTTTKATVTTTATTGAAKTPTTAPAATSTTVTKTTGTSRTTTTKTTTTTTPRHHRGVPALALNPQLGPPGTLVAVSGHGFPKDRLVTISWSVSTGSVVARTNSKGQLKATLIILVPDVLGPRSANAKGFRASARFLVVPGSGQPGGSDPDPIYRTESP